MVDVSKTPIIDDGIAVVTQYKKELGEGVPVSGELYSYRICGIQSISSRLTLVNTYLGVGWSGPAKLIFISQIEALIYSANAFLVLLKKVAGCLDGQASAVAETRKSIDMVIEKLFEKRILAKDLTDSGLTLESDYFQCEAALAAVSETHSVTGRYQELSRQNAGVVNDVNLCMIDLGKKLQRCRCMPLLWGDREHFSHEQLLKLGVEFLRFNSGQLAEISAELAKVYGMYADKSYLDGKPFYRCLNAEGNSDYIGARIMITQGQSLSKSFWSSAYHLEDQGNDYYLRIFGITLEELAENLNCAAGRFELSDSLAMAELAADW